MRQIAVILGAILLTISVLAVEGRSANAGKSQSIESGKKLFSQNCASCHGDDAKGAGPAAVALKVQPPDLTQLARQKNGKFPYDDVKKTIAGESSVSAHGSREMPTWGPLFLAMTGENQKAVDQRITNLADYLKSIQTK
jgi:mono/diheme cytochrome c family protein